MKRCLVVAAVLILSSGCAGIIPSTVQGVPMQFKERQIIVTLPLDSLEKLANRSRALAKDYKISKTGDFPLTSIGVQCFVYEVPDGSSIDQVIAQLDTDPRVESVQANQVFNGLRGTHTDPYASLQHGAASIRADEAHQRSTGSGVKIAVVDTGVDKGHPDLRGQIFQTANFVEGGGLSFTRDPHGTGVAGVIGARADDGVGIFGVAPEAEILAAKACWYAKPDDPQAQCSSWTLAKAIDFAINAGVQIINLSLAGPPDPLLTRLLETAAAEGTIIIAAVAPTNAPDPGFPASLAAVIAVIASDQEGRVSLPIWADEVNLVAAPGMEILTTAPREAYDFLSGSSLAAAHITGIVALLLEQDPQLSFRKILSLLRNSALSASTKAQDPTPQVSIVDACAALAALEGTPDCN